jgi:hypothetical protein
MTAVTALLLEVVDQAFDRRAWHGTGLWGSVRGLTPRDARWRPSPGRHCIWELVLHAAYWKYIVRRRLERDPDLEFPRAGSNCCGTSTACCERPSPASRSAGCATRAGAPAGATSSTSTASRRMTCITRGRYS